MASLGAALGCRPAWCWPSRPMVNVGTFKVVLQPDEWTIVTEDGSLSAHYEHTVAITDNGPMILTLPEG